MFKLLFITSSFLFSLGLYAQEPTLSGNDGKIKYNITLEKITDKVNDQFYEYYSLDLTNTSNSEVTFIPVFNYTNELGIERSFTSKNDSGKITLKAGETVKGSLEKNRDLTLFRQYLVGNSGKKASNAKYELKTITIKY